MPTECESDLGLSPAPHVDLKYSQEGRRPNLARLPSERGCLISRLQTLGEKGAISKVSCEMLELEPWELARGEFLGSMEGTRHKHGSLDGG